MKYLLLLFLSTYANAAAYNIIFETRPFVWDQNIVIQTRQNEPGKKKGYCFTYVFHESEPDTIIMMRIAHNIYYAKFQHDLSVEWSHHYYDFKWYDESEEEEELQMIEDDIHEN